MSDTFVQLPTDGSGKAIRLLEGDGTTTQIPANVYEEAVVPTDGQGLLPGDRRQQGLMVLVDDGVQRQTLDCLRRIEMILRVGLDVDIPDDTFRNEE